jgi:hypothetical protein
MYEQILRSCKAKMQAIMQAPFPEQVAARSEPWEQLVTEGHVRAARVRMIAPYIIGFGILAVMAGVYGLLLMTSNTSLPSMSEILQKRLNAFKAPVIQPFQYISTVPSMTMEQMKDVPPASELPKVIEMLKASLQANEAYPKEFNELIKEVNPSTFWQGKWPAVGIMTINKGNLRAFGTTVIQDTDKLYGGGMPARWIGIFKHISKEWLIVSINYPGMIAPREFPAAPPDELSVSLKSLMDTK